MKIIYVWSVWNDVSARNVYFFGMIPVSDKFHVPQIHVFMMLREKKNALSLQYLIKVKH